MVINLRFCEITPKRSHQKGDHHDHEESHKARHREETSQHRRRQERRLAHGKKPVTNRDSKTSLNQPLPEGMLGTKEVAAKLKITPRHLRVVLRSMGKGTGGERYMWKEGSPELAKIAEAVKEHDAKAEAQKSSADPHQR